MLAEGNEISRGLKPRGEVIGESTTRVVATSSSDDDRRVTSPDYSQVAAIEARALRSEGNGPVPWCGLQSEFVKRTPGKNSSAVPSALHGI